VSKHKKYITIRKTLKKRQKMNKNEQKTTKVCEKTELKVKKRQKMSFVLRAFFCEKGTPFSPLPLRWRLGPRLVLRVTQVLKSWWMVGGRPWMAGRTIF